jgi:hypothetical protein
VNAIDRYLRFPELPYCWVETSADIVVLTLDREGSSWYFRCIEKEEPQGMYPLLRKLKGDSLKKVPRLALGQALQELSKRLAPNPEWQRIRLRSFLVSP